MEKFQLTLLFKIIGLGSASGLIYTNSSIIAIGDNSSYLYEYSLETLNLKRTALTANPQENIEKKVKLDFEAITQHQDTIYIFGSGSTENRNTMVKIDAKTKKIIEHVDLSNLYLALQSFGEIKSEDFNIEGVVFDGTTWYFFNRGNGDSQKNIVFSVDGKNLTNEFRIVANSYKLPKIKGVRTSFTDAVLIDDKLYFLATAEDSKSTYLDGEILGSIIGQIDVKKMKIDFTQKITSKNKFEGLSLYKKSATQLEFLLCEDNDTEILESAIYKLTLNLN